MFRVLLVCSANRCRSAAAEAILRHTTQGLDVSVESAGTMELVSSPALPSTVAVLDASGIDISRHRSRHISQTEPAEADLVIGFEQFHVAMAVAAGASPNRSFTLHELLRLLETAPLPGPQADPGSIVAAAAAERERGAAFVPGDDMADPAGGTDEEIRATTTEVARLTRRLAHHLFGTALPRERRKSSAPRKRKSGALKSILVVVVVVSLVAIAIAAWIVVERLPGGGPVSDILGSDEPGTDDLPVAPFSEPTVVGRLDDRELDEVSGLVASWANKGLYWAHEDSGNDPLISCIEARGDSCGVWRVAEVPYAQDWEDIGIGKGPGGAPHLYIGDIGDNGERRPGIVIVRVPEPDAASAETTTSGATTEPAAGFRFTYPDGAHDAEALIVHPKTTDIYVITKRPVRVYVARAPFDESRIEVLESIAEVDLPPITGASITRDGRRVVLGTYKSAYELTRPDGGFDQIWTTTPKMFQPGEHEQGEAIAYRTDGDAVLSTSEGERAPIYEVRRTSD